MKQKLNHLLLLHYRLARAEVDAANCQTQWARETLYAAQELYDAAYAEFLKDYAE